MIHLLLFESFLSKDFDQTENRQSRRGKRRENLSFWALAFLTRFVMKFKQLTTLKLWTMLAAKLYVSFVKCKIRSSPFRVAKRQLNQKICWSFLSKRIIFLKIFGNPEFIWAKRKVAFVIFSFFLAQSVWFGQSELTNRGNDVRRTGFHPTCKPYNRAQTLYVSARVDWNSENGDDDVTWSTGVRRAVASAAAHLPCFFAMKIRHLWKFVGKKH